MCNVIWFLSYTVYETILQNLNVKSNILKHFPEYVCSCPYDLEGKKFFLKRKNQKQEEESKSIKKKKTFIPLNWKTGQQKALQWSDERGHRLILQLHKW